MKCRHTRRRRRCLLRHDAFATFYFTTIISIIFLRYFHAADADAMPALLMRRYFSPMLRCRCHAALRRYALRR